MKVHNYYTYITTNASNNVLYVGVTSDIQGRIWDHKQKTFKGFTSRYQCDKLVYFEEYQWIHDAIAREKQLKGGSRKSKIDLVINENPDWIDLSAEWFDSL